MHHTTEMRHMGARRFVQHSSTVVLTMKQFMILVPLLLGYRVQSSETANSLPGGTNFELTPLSPALSPCEKLRECTKRCANICVDDEETCKKDKNTCNNFCESTHKCSPCEKLQECTDTCATSANKCVDDEKTCKKDKKKCKKSCESEYKCPSPPSPPPSCEDNTIPGFGSRWCVRNAPDPSFCSNEAHMNKCKKTCGLC